MWFRLSTAEFTTNIGTMNTWSITRVLGTGVSYSGNTSVDKGASFSATVTLTDTTNYKVKSYTVTMDGVDITSSSVTTSDNITYNISIAEVTGSVKINFVTENINTGEEDSGSSGGTSGGGASIDVSARTTSNSYAQSLPSGITSTTNLWNTLTPEAKYYDSTGSYVTYQTVSSITFPVLPGDKLTATSFGANPNGINGIRITYLSDDTVVSSLAAADVYSEYTSNGYLTVPSSVNAVNIPVWDNTLSGYEVYLFPVGASGTPTKPSNSSSGDNSGSDSDTSGNINDTTGATWYVNHLNNGAKFTASVNIAGRGWCHKEDTPAYNAYVGKPVNVIGFFSTKDTQNVTVMKLSSSTDSTGTVLATVTPTAVDGNFKIITFPEVTLASGEYLGAFCQADDDINFFYATGAVTDANGIVDGNFYGRVPQVYGTGTAWSSYSATSVCLGWSIGYIAS